MAGYEGTSIDDKQSWAMHMLQVKKPGAYDYALALATIIILVALSAIFIYGTLESWRNSVQNSEWTMTWLYTDYLNRMNAYVYPFVLSLVLVLCMCIPKRFVPRTYLLQSSLVLLALSVMAGVVWGFVAGLGFLLIVSAIVQLFVVVLTAARSGNLVFEREGAMVQLGSALLHLGFVVFVLDLILVGDVRQHLSVFWTSTILITAGTVLSFYSKELIRFGRLGEKRRAQVSGLEVDADEEPENDENAENIESSPDRAPALEFED